VPQDGGYFSGVGDDGSGGETGAATLGKWRVWGREKFDPLQWDSSCKCWTSYAGCEEGGWRQPQSETPQAQGQSLRHRFHNLVAFVRKFSFR